MTFPHARAAHPGSRHRPHGRALAGVSAAVLLGLLPFFFTGCGGQPEAGAGNDAEVKGGGPALAQGPGVPATPPPAGSGRKALVGGPEPVTPADPAAPAPASSPLPPPVSPFALPMGGPTQVEDRAAVRVQPARFEYGRVFEGAQVHASFAVTSSGEVPLVVHGVQASCGCTVPKLWLVDASGSRVPYTVGHEVAVGDKLEVDVAFDTRSRTGRQDRPVFLYANLPGGRVDLELVGEVQPFLVAQPPELHFGGFLQGESRELPFEVKSADGAPVLLSVHQDALPRGIDLEFEALEPNAEGKSARWRGLARIGPGADVSVLRWPVTLMSDRSSAGPSGDVPLGGGLLLAAEIRAALEFAPPHLALGVLAAQSVRSQSVRLLVHDASIEVGDLEFWTEVDFADGPGHDFVRARLVPRAEGAADLELEVTVSGLPAGTPGRLSGRVFVGLVPGLPLASLGFAGVAHGR